MKAFISILIALALVALLAAGIFFVTSSDEDEEPATAPQEAQVVPRMSTSGVVANIDRRLEARAGEPLTVRCPKKVDAVIGTTFRCSVRREGVDRRIAVAEVEIDGPDGDFSWSSTPVSNDSGS